MKELSRYILSAVAAIATAVSCGAGTLRLTMTGTITGVSGAYMTARVHVGDPFTVYGTFDSTVVPTQTFSHMYDFSYSTSLTFTTGQITLTAPTFIGTAQDNYTGNFSQIYDGYVINATSAATSYTSGLTLSCLLQSTNLNVVASPPAGWMTTMDPAVFNHVNYFRVSGNDTVNPYPAYLVDVSGTIQTITVTSGPAQEAPSITGQPADKTVASGNSTTFTVTTGGFPPPTLRWQRQPAGGGGFSNLSNDGTYSGVTTGTLTVKSVGTAVGNSGDQFRCVATNVAGTATSAAATLTVLPFVLPTITSQPQSVVASEGSNPSFSVTATSPTAMTYAWFESTDGVTYSPISDSAFYSGSATSTLTLIGVLYSQVNGHYFRCSVANLSGAVNTTAAQLTVSLPPAIVQLSAGKYHSLRVDATAAFSATGGNGFGQLGTGDTTQYVTPQVITLPGGRVVAAVSAGSEHSLILTTGGELWVMGLNANGQLGDGTLAAKSTPFQVASNVAGIAGGKFHSAFLKADGTLWTVGANDSGQLGNGSVSGANVLTPVQIATNVVDLAAGTRQTLYVKSDGTLWATGDLYNNGTLIYTPIQIATGVKTVAAGGYHSLFLKTDGTAWAQGYNLYGQLGDTTNTTRTSPVQIASSVTAIAAGPFHSAILKTDGTLWTFGQNNAGQVGDSTLVNKLSPIQVAVTVTSVTASESDTMFTNSDGSLWATGANLNGQFGLASPTSSLVPLRITGGHVALPNIPTLVLAGSSDALDLMNVTWQPTGTALGYEVWRSSANDFTTATRVAQNVRWGFYQDTTAVSNTTYYYWIRGVSAGGTSAPSTAASGSFGTATSPAFFIQPLSQSVLTGSSATFTAVATGAPHPTLQWQRLPAGSGTWTDLSNAGSYSGVTTSILTVSGTTSGMSGDQFRCVATNYVASVNSDAVTLTVGALTAPAITSQPQPQSVVWPAAASFTVAVSGIPNPTLQWQRRPAGSGTWSDLANAGSYSGVTTLTLTVSNTAIIMNGDQFRCVAANASGSATSNAAALTVTPPPNAITFISNTFPNLVGSSNNTTIVFTCNVANAGAASWNSSHVLWLKDASRTNLVSAPLSGVAPGGSLLTSFSFTAPWAPGTYTYYLQATVSGINFGTEVPLTLTVLTSGQQPPVVQYWPSVTFTDGTYGFNFTAPDAGPGGPFTYQWYRDGVAIPGATSSIYSFGRLATQADEGNYTVKISNAVGWVISPDMPLVFTSRTIPWRDVGRVGDVLYFLFDGTGVISRYDLAAEAWLSQVTLSGTPTAFLPTPEGVFIAYGTSLVRRTVDLQPIETPVTTSTVAINRLLGYGNLIYFHNGPDYYSNVVTFNRSTLSPGPVFVTGLYSGMAEFEANSETVFDPISGRGFFTRPNVSPNDVQRYNIAGDGTFNSEIDSPYHGTFQVGQHLYLTPDAQSLIDSSGNVYKTADLTQTRSMGLPFDDMVFLSDGTPILLRGKTMARLDPTKLVETDRVTFTSGPNYRAFSRQTSTYVFGALIGDNLPNVLKVQPADFAPVVPAGFNPALAQFSMDDMFIDPTGVIHVLSRSAHGVVRWSVNDRGFLPTLPLRGAPALASYAGAANRYVLAYGDGTLTHFNLGTSTTETAFGGQPPYQIFGMVTMDDLVVFLNQDSGDGGEFRRVIDAGGGTKDIDSSRSYYGNVQTWQSALRRLYSNQFQSTNLGFETVPTTGILTGITGNVANLTTPLRPNLSGTRVLAVNGVITDADLNTVATLSNAVLDGAWLPSGLYTIRDQIGSTQVQLWSADTSSGQVGSLNLPGSPLRIFRVDDNTLVVVTSVNGYIAFHTISASLTLIDSSANNTLHAALGAPVFITQPSAQSVNAAAPATFTVAASGNPALTFQWQRLPAGSGTWSNLGNGGSYSGVTTATLTVSGPTVGMNGDQFRCVVSNVVASVISNTASLTVAGASAATKDFNADGKSDILWENSVTGDRAIWLMNGSSFLAGGVLGTIPVAWKIAGVADFNGDGKADILWENTVTGDHSIWFMNGTTFLSGGYLGVIPTDWHVACVGDLNGDGRADIIWENTVTGDRAVWLMDGATFLAGGSLGNLPVDWKITRSADFNGDGKSDLMLENTTTGDRVIWLMNGTTFIGGGLVATLPSTWKIAGTADFNNDGKADILWENTATGDHSIWLMDGTSFLSGASLGTIPIDWSVAGTGDYNGDGMSDIIWTNSVTGDRSIWLMNGTGFLAGGYLGVVPTDWRIGK